MYCGMVKGKILMNKLLFFSSIVGAIAGGNTAIVKVTTNSSNDDMMVTVVSFYHALAFGTVWSYISPIGRALPSLHGPKHVSYCKWWCPWIDSPSLAPFRPCLLYWQSACRQDYHGSFSKALDTCHSRTRWEMVRSHPCRDPSPLLIFSVYFYK